MTPAVTRRHTAIPQQRCRFSIETVRFRDDEGNELDPEVCESVIRGPLTLHDAFCARIIRQRQIDLEHSTARIVDIETGVRL